MLREVKDWLEKTYPFVGLVKNPQDHSTDNGILYTAQWMAIDPTLTRQDKSLFSLTLSICTQMIGSVWYFVRYPNTLETTSHDDLIGAFAFMRQHGYVDQAKFLYKTLNGQKWLNGTEDLSRFYTMREFGNFCANDKLGLKQVFWIGLAFLIDKWSASPVAGKIKDFLTKLTKYGKYWPYAPKGETDGRCKLLLMKDILKGHGFVLDKIMSSWANTMYKLYPEGRRGIFGIYFGADHPITKNCPEVF